MPRAAATEERRFEEYRAPSRDTRLRADTLDDDAYWIPREAVQKLTALRCPYVRLQALPDHAQPHEVRHAMRMARAAERALRAGTLPWFQLNDHPRDEVPARPRWLAGGPIAANIAIRRKLRALRQVLHE